MKKAELTRRITRQSKLTRAAAADQLDRVVHDILQRVRKGQPASLPGLGTFTPGQYVDFCLDLLPDSKPAADPKKGPA